MRDTIDMAREAGWKDLRDYDSEMRNDFFMGNTDNLKAFEALVRADEREACAKVCEDLSLSQNSEWEVGTLDCADAIRARGNT
jgi:hypothetical protein